MKDGKKCGENHLYGACLKGTKEGNSGGGAAPAKEGGAKKPWWEKFKNRRGTQQANVVEHRLNDALSPRGVVVEAVPLRTITLPQRLVQAIEDKMRQEQEHERMQFVLMKERAEAERKEIEAAGIAQFQKVVSEGISKELLQWKGIEATQAIAEGTNSKVVVIGTGGSDGLPVILGGLDSA